MCSSDLLTTTWWGWAHKTIYFVASSQGKDKKINLSLLIPREFDINPWVIPCEGKTVFPILYTLHLESQPNHCFLTQVTPPSHFLAPCHQVFFGAVAELKAIRWQTVFLVREHLTRRIYIRAIISRYHKLQSSKALCIIENFQELYSCNKSTNTVRGRWLFSKAQLSTCLPQWHYQLQ